MTSTLAPPQAAVARTEHATKIYGSGETAVRALDDVSVDVRGRAVHGDHGPVRFRASRR